ncbi:protein FAR-RED IMPAIRED RESPONSE 1-like [Carex rostrata]
MKNCLYYSITTEQFDNEWKRIMKDYKLMDDEWLNNLFDIRQSWIPIYNRTIFYVGMNITQRCESIHSFFDSFLNKGTTLREFVVKYEHALEHRYRAEHAERFTSIYKTPILKLKSPLEEQAADLKKKKLEKSGSSSKYKVSSFHNTKDAFIVTLDVEMWEVFCECHLFEFKGILCCHVLKNFSEKDVENIPSKYILPRWTKKVREGISIPLFKKDGDKSSMVSDLKFNDLMSRLRTHLHVSTDAHDIIMEALEGALKRVSNLELEENKEGKESATITIDRVENMVEHPSIANPCIAKTKGRKKEDVSVSKNGRFRSGLEVRMKNSKKSKRQCKNCGQYDHYSSTCERRKQAGVMEDV